MKKNTGSWALKNSVPVTELKTNYSSKATSLSKCSVTMMSKRTALMELRSGYRNKNHAAPEGHPGQRIKNFAGNLFLN